MFSYSNAALYNKLFTKILDSSIWLEDNPTRIVWLTFIAAMDEHGFCAFASAANVARRAVVSLKEAKAAIAKFEGPDSDSGDSDNEGRRLERVPGGWIVLNATKYRDMVTKAIIQEQTRERVRKHRAGKAASNASVTPLTVTGQNGNASVTPSEARAEAKEESRERKSAASRPFLSDSFTDQETTERAGRFIERYQALYSEHRKGARYAVRPARDYAAAVTLCQTWPDERLDKLAVCFLTTDHRFAEEGSRTIPQFLALASWADGELAKWELQQKAR